MPERELELIQDMERPQEEEPPPETMPPEFDMTPPANLDNASARPNLSFKGKKAGVFADGSYVPIFQVPPVYPRRAQERGIEGCVMLEFIVIEVGLVRDPVGLWATRSGIVGRAATRSAMKFKYKPQISDGEPIEVKGVMNQITFIIEDKDKGLKVAGYGATSKSTTILNYCDVGNDLIDYFVDTTPIKQNTYTPGKHIPVLPYSAFIPHPEVPVLFAWNHKQEIMNKEKDSGGKWITHFIEEFSR